MSFFYVWKVKISAWRVDLWRNFGYLVVIQYNYNKYRLKNTKTQRSFSASLPYPLNVRIRCVRSVDSSNKNIYVVFPFLWSTQLNSTAFFFSALGEHFEQAPPRDVIALLKTQPDRNTTDFPPIWYDANLWLPALNIDITCAFGVNNKYNALVRWVGKRRREDCDRYWPRSSFYEVSHSS